MISFIFSIFLTLIPLPTYSTENFCGHWGSSPTQVAPIISVFQVVTFLAIPANVFFKKWVNPGLFFIYFRLFQTHITSCSTNKCEKCPSSIWCQYLKSRPLEHEFLQPLDQGFISCLRFKLQKVDIRKIDPIQ